MQCSVRHRPRFAYCNTNGRHGTAPALRLAHARSFWERAAGLFRQGRPGWHQGLLINPCNAVHTFGLTYAIDVVFLGRNGRVLKTVHALRPNRVAWCSSAHSVVEFPAFYCRRVSYHEASLRRALCGVPGAGNSRPCCARRSRLVRC